MKGKEILFIAEALQNEKDVDQEDVFGALEAALAAATRRASQDDIEVRIEIDRGTGEYRTYRRWKVLDDEDPSFASPDYQILLSAAREHDDSLEAGDYIEEEIESIPFGRISAHAAKQVIAQKLREAERMHIVSLYKPLVSTVVMAVAKRQEDSGLYVELSNNVEGFVPREEMIPNERIRLGQRIRAYLLDVREEMRGPQLILSRISPEFLVKMFEIEVLEVGQGLIEIVGAARDPGVRAKVAVRSNDPRLDPVGACVGMRGSRVQSVSNEIAEEKIDIVPWDEDLKKYVTHAMSPATVTSIVINEARRKIDVAVEEEKLSLAIGRGGQNVRLASKLLGWHINVITDKEAAENKQEEITALIKRFIEDLDVDEEIATILVQEGYTNIEEIAFASDKELLNIEEFDEKIVAEMCSRARDVMLARAVSSEADESENGLMAVEGMDEVTAQKLMTHGINTLQDLADQAVDDLLEVPGIEKKQAAELIMAARKPMFEESEEDEATAVAGSAGAADVKSEDAVSPDAKGSKEDEAATVAESAGAVDVKSEEAMMSDAKSSKEDEAATVAESVGAVDVKSEEAMMSDAKKGSSK